MEDVAKFLFEVGMLSKTPRSGFQFLGTGNQSVAEHLNRTSYIGYVLASLDGEVDMNKVLKMCMFHDLTEARISDLNYVHQKYVERREGKAIEDLTKQLPFGEDMREILEEYEKRITPEAVLAKDADNVEWILSLKEQLDNGNKKAREWIESAVKRLKTSVAKELVEKVLEIHSDDWWFEDKNGDWWVNRNKEEIVDEESEEEGKEIEGNFEGETTMEDNLDEDVLEEDETLLFPEVLNEEDKSEEGNKRITNTEEDNEENEEGEEIVVEDKWEESEEKEDNEGGDDEDNNESDWLKKYKDEEENVDEEDEAEEKISESSFEEDGNVEEDVEGENTIFDSVDEDSSTVYDLSKRDKEILTLMDDVPADSYVEYVQRFTDYLRVNIVKTVETFIEMGLLEKVTIPEGDDERSWYFHTKKVNRDMLDTEMLFRRDFSSEL